MDGRCIKHPFEISEHACRNCGNDFCDECLVFAFGPDKPPYCVPCALAAAGVRSNAATPAALSRREIRRREKERKKAEKASKRTPVTPTVQLADDDGSARPPAFGEGGNPLSWDSDGSGERVHF